MSQREPRRFLDPVGLVLKRIPSEFLSLERLGLPPVVGELITRPSGLFLVTGPPGSGRTTTLTSIISDLCRQGSPQVIRVVGTHNVEPQQQAFVFNEREVRMDAASFAEAVSHAENKGWVVVLDGEFRDPAMISTAIAAAEKGNRVFGTLHTTNARDTIDRIIDLFPNDQQEQIRTRLASVLRGIVSQALLPRKPKGMVAAFEMLVGTPNIAKLIRDDNIVGINSSIRAGRKYGMQLLDDALFDLGRNGLCEERDVVLRANNPGELQFRIWNAKKGHCLERNDDDPDDDVE